MARIMVTARAAGLYLAAIAAPAMAETRDEAPADQVEDLSRLSIEELARINVSSASKIAEPLSSAPTALYVLTGDEILRSPALSIPEALRLAPNLWVQQVDSRQYAISARGFNGIEPSNKLLVLRDGRSLYSPLASSVFWELQNLPVEEIRNFR